MLGRVFAVEQDPQPVLARQQRIIAYGRDMAEKGWTVAQEMLTAIGNAKKLAF